MSVSGRRRETGAPPTLVDYVVTNLRDEIVSGAHPFGAKLDQLALAERFGVSVVPIRESLRRLQSEGLVTFHPRRGASVIELSADELEEVYLIRGVLEELSTQLAVPSLSLEMLDRLGHLIDESEKGMAREEYDLVLDVNREFHFTIYEASDRPILLETIARVHRRSSPYRRLYSRMRDMGPRVLAYHTGIHAACAAGDAVTAGRLVREDIQEAARHIVERFASEVTAEKSRAAATE
jgi:DNA-binding GntR family transcriptional regulator